MKMKISKKQINVKLYEFIKFLCFHSNFDKHDKLEMANAQMSSHPTNLFEKVSLRYK